VPSSTELARTQIITRDGVVTATVLDTVSPDRIALMLIRGSAAAKFARTTDNTATVSKDVRDLLVFPLTVVS
jgi:hypothetical protein